LTDLLSKRKDITNTLIPCGHAAELHQELNSRIDHGNPTDDYAAGAAYQHEHSRRGLALSDESQLTVNTADINRSRDELAIPDENIWAESPDESESDNDIYDQIIVPSHLIVKAADLSQYNHINSPLSFENIFARESSLSPCNGGYAELKGVLNDLDGDLTMSLSTPTSPLMLPASGLEQNRL
jgi:hypothetical protein